MSNEVKQSGNLSAKLFLVFMDKLNILLNN